MATLTDADLKNRLEHGVWLDEIDRSFRDWRAAPNADKPHHLLSGMMLTWAEGRRMTNPSDFSPSVHTYISRSVQAQAAKSSAEREAKTVEVQRRDRVYQQILLLMALFAIVLLAPAVIRQSLVGPEQIAVAPDDALAPTRPAATAAAVMTQDPAPESVSLTRNADAWASTRLLDRARKEARSSALGPVFALEALAAQAQPGDNNATNRKWLETALSLTAELTGIKSEHAMLPTVLGDIAALDVCGGRRLSVRKAGGDMIVADFASGARHTRAVDPALSMLPAATDRDCRHGLAVNLDYEVLLLALDDAARPPRRLGAHDAPVVSARFNADTTRAVTVSRDGVVKVWDIATGKELRSLPSPGDLHIGAALSPDGRLLVTWTDRPGAMLWTVETGASKGSLGGHLSRLVDAHFADGGDKLLTISIDGTAMMWRTAPLAVVAALRPRGGSILKAWTTRDASRVIAELDGDRVQVWDIAAAAPLADLAPGDGKVRHLAADPLGKVVATADATGMTTIWDAATGTRLLTVNQPPVPLKALMVADDAASVIGITETSTLSWALPRTLEAAKTMLVALGGCTDLASRASHKLPASAPSVCPAAAEDVDMTPHD